MKIDWVVPSYRGMKADCFQGLIAMKRKTESHGHDVEFAEIVNNGYPHWARNDGISHIRPDCEAVLFVDDDMAPPTDSLVRLLASLSDEVPIVSGLCVSRGIPVKLCLTAWDPVLDTFKAVEYVEEDRVMVGNLGVGAAFLLVKRTVIDAVAQQWLTAEDWLADNRATFDRLGVSKFRREEERKRISEMRAEFVTSGANRAVPVIFNLHDTDSGYQFGEDIGFCRRCLQLGFPVAVDTTVQIGHIGDFPYHPSHLGMRTNAQAMIA